MKLLISSVAAAAALAVLPAGAGAYVSHTVAPGETLWGIAAANNFTTRSLAAYNGLSPDSNVVLGTNIKIPSVPEAASALQGAGVSTQGGGTGPAVSSPGPSGSYIVRPGDSLTAIASQSGIAVSQLAWMNGLDPDNPLLIGTVLKLPTEAPLAQVPEQAPAQRVVPNANPHPTNERVSGGTIDQIAAAHGVPASLAKAIAWQESGWNNSMVSDANARGVMQIMPGTWDWINRNLASAQLNPNSAIENVHAGVLYLGQLLHDTGGDVPTAVASYYQGLGSVQQRGMYDDTKQYVNSVLSLKARFGG
ncbi:MAG: LysM peptidoglycan-binding domain-containing protein [Thermoleophilaceae bacterium]